MVGNGRLKPTPQERRESVVVIVFFAITVTLFLVALLGVLFVVFVVNTMKR